jgi:hypothetical protein
MLLGRVFDGYKMLALSAAVAHRRYGFGRIRTQVFGKGLVSPGARNDPGTMMGSHLMLIGLYQSFEGIWMNIAFVDQKTFQGFHSNFNIAERAIAMLVSCRHGLVFDDWRCAH